METARGFPVVTATVEYPGRGYAAEMGWIQVIFYSVGSGESATVLVDKPPQLSDDDSPYFCWGLNPSFFDAPSTPESNVNWEAHAFLTASPDALMTKVVRPLCGLSWGYKTRDDAVEILPIQRIGPGEWLSARVVLRDRYPRWNFLVGQTGA